tara:strand:+ start:472 stop:666 length:195 start_codon:yes stop_codon:yes gene_type:complete
MLFKMPLSTKYRNEIIDICCRIISTDGEVSLKERIWMNKLCDHNLHAKELVGSLLSDDLIEEEL